jgi:hypothetical protein
VSAPRRRWLLAALAVLTLAAHLPVVASTLDDLDSFNFALALHDFDPRRHQPHPPGYPVIVGLGRTARQAVAALGADGAAADARALASVSAVFGAASILPLFMLFGHLERLRRPGDSGGETIALAATVVVVTTPLMWFAMARPMSDVPGLALALAAQALLVGAWLAFRERAFAVGDRRLVFGAVAAALAVGARSQGLWLVAPILVLALVGRRGAGARRAQLIALAAAALACLAWLVPLLVVSGGLDGYLATLADQAGEDFAGVEMLWTTRSARVAAMALRHSMVDVWGPVPVAVLLLVATAAGTAAVMLKSVPALLVAAVLWAPYFVFHVLFQETVTTRYGLPIVPPLAWLAVVGLSLISRPVLAVAVAAFAIVSLAQTMPALARYAADGSPVSRAVAAMAGASPGTGIAVHHAFARAFDVERGIGRPVTARRGREWLEVAARWHRDGTGPRWLLAERHRTDIALFDPASRTTRGEYGWTFDAARYLGGTRPGAAVWYELAERPGWILGPGWAVTPELSGIAARDGEGLTLGPIDAVVRRRPGPALMVVGGRHLGGAGTGPVELQVAVDGRPLDRWSTGPGGFLRQVVVPEGGLAGEGYARLTVAARPASPDVPVAIEQFDLQSQGTAVWAFGDGWHEAEFDARSRRAFRWSSARAELLVLQAVHDLDLILEVDSPLKYFDEPPIVTISGGEEVLARTRVDGPFTWRVRVPVAALARSGGIVAVSTDRVFRPADTGSADRRELGLRFFTVSGSR